ncbi:AI-2E family transporter [Clostridiaceae bacterium 35-E11]
MKYKYNRRNLSHYINILMIVIVGIIFYKFMDNMDGVYSSFSEKIGTILATFKPFILGVIMAYIMNPVIKWVDKNVIQGFIKDKKINRYSRLMSTLCVFIFLGCMISWAAVHMMPRLVMNIRDLLSGLPEFIYENESKMIAWVNNLYSNDVYNIGQTIEENINQIFYRMSQIFQRSLNNLLTGLIAATSSIFNIILAVIVSFYILIDKDALIKESERLLRALLPDKYVNHLKQFCKEADTIFVKFVIGKSIDSFIIGVMCFIGLSLMKSPYILLISLIVGITNMIPYFGPLIGEVIGFIFVSFYSPVKALWVLLFLFILQQFDSFYLTPKILGDKMGLNPLWIIFSIVLGGSLFGVIGMFLGVPAISVMVVAVRRFVDKRLQEKSMMDEINEIKE